MSANALICRCPPDLCGKVRRVKGKLIALLVVVLLVALAAWAEWTLEVIPFKRRDVAMPSLSASPQEVVTAYVEALDAHDCDTAEELWLSDKDTPQMWCSGVSRAQIVGDTDAFHESARRIDVPLKLNVRWRPFKDDGTIEGDPFPWSYILTQDARGAWRIVDNGQG